MDERLVQLWQSRDWDKEDVEYADNSIEEMSARQLAECVVEVGQRTQCESRTGWEYVEQEVVSTISKKNEFKDPITREQYEFLVDNTVQYGTRNGYDLDVACSRGEAAIQTENVAGREIICGFSNQRASLHDIHSWSAVVWDESEFDEVVSVPEDIQAVDMHEAYQNGEHLEYGKDFVVCRFEGDFVRFDF